MDRLKRKQYEELAAPMQIELVAMARWAATTGKRVLILFEGRDTAGKGGEIKAVAENLNPRQCRIVALPKPTEAEANQWYFQRYVGQLPGKGEIALFDRSWYNRAGVEKVMGFASDAQVAAFLDAVPRFEKMLVDDGILLFKYWLTCDQVEQEKRFQERLTDPLKQWKLSPIDEAARRHYADYTEARTTMLKTTHSRRSPWSLVDFNDQRRGRLTLIRHLLDRLPGKDLNESPLSMEPLGHAPITEEFDGLKPIKLIEAGSE